MAVLGSEWGRTIEREVQLCMFQVGSHVDLQDVALRTADLPLADQVADAALDPCADVPAHPQEPELPGDRLLEVPLLGRAEGVQRRHQESLDLEVGDFLDL